MKRLPVLCLSLWIALPLLAGQGGKIDSRLTRALSTLHPEEQTFVWVFFTDKGTHEHLRHSVPNTVVSERSILRRAKVRPVEALVDYTDLPVDQAYVQRLAGYGVQIRQQSRWMNGVSVSATAAQIGSMEALPFVRSLELVARFRRDAVESETPQDGPPSPGPEGVVSFNYGASFTQVNQMAVPAVHDRGNYGQGVVVGVFDNGFRLLTHEAFDTLRPRIIATYDFVDHKVSVVPNNPDPTVGAHGVNTLSTIGGFKSAQLIGPAFGATYILARTENDSSETPFEEDNWVAAIEWADSIGVDVTSTSLGYLTYEAPYTSWTWQDMNGNTTAITRAADMAVGRGILVVNSAGNEGANPSHNTLGAPADGDSVFTIGAVTSTGTRSSFSSVGPTTSVPARIKPDVMAQGSTVRVASATNTTGYTTSQGTSFSCPLAAGAAALMVHARPTDSPVEIMNILRATASRASSPDNQYGWGILNLLAALTPASVSPLVPVNAATDRDTALALFWSRSRWAITYRVQVATDPLFTTILLNDSTVSDTVRLLAGLGHGATYYWRVSARNIYGTSAFSAIFSFSTSAQPPAATTLVSPADGAVDLPTAVTLIWNPAAMATRYHVQAAGDSLFTSAVLDDSTITGISTSFSGLSYSTLWFWRVRAGNGAGWGPETPVWRFTTAPAPPAPPVLVSPADSAENLPLTLTLLWNQTEGAATYQVRVSAHQDFSNPVLNDSTLTDTSITIGPLQPGVRYYWQVRGRIPTGPGPWPAHRQFTTSPGVVRSYALASGWNLLSLPLAVPDPTPGAVFPSASSSPFRFIPEAGYTLVDSLAIGTGYWVKFDAAESLALAGNVVLNDTVAVSHGWNLIGMISSPLDTATVSTLPPAIRISGFYRYDPLSGYQEDTTLEPGRGYWVKMGGSGVLLLRQETLNTTPARKPGGSPVR
jgi:serine protease AprX